MAEVYPIPAYCDGGGTRPVVAEPHPNGYTLRMWYGPGPADHFDTYTDAGMRTLHPAGTGPISYASHDPIGSRFD